jgi:hypothetical protein
MNGLDLEEIRTNPIGHSQRWSNGRSTWRRTSEGGFDPRRYAVEAISEAAAKAFVCQHHYAKTFPAAAHRFGLFDVSGDQPQLVGAAVYGIPVQAAVLTSTFPTLAPYTESIELSRLVLLDEVPSNAESFAVARTFKLLREHGVRGVVSFADPVPRRTLDGRLALTGHVGCVYASLGAAYTGRGTARSLSLLPDATVLNARAQQKVRQQERGHEYVERLLISYGAPAMRAGQNPAEWLAEAKSAIGVRTLRHRGAHRYAFRLGANQRQRDRIPLGHATITGYPKQIDAEQS